MIPGGSDALSPRKMSLFHRCAFKQLVAGQHALLEPMASLANGMACQAIATCLKGDQEAAALMKGCKIAMQVQLEAQLGGQALCMSTGSAMLAGYHGVAEAHA